MTKKSTVETRLAVGDAHTCPDLLYWTGFRATDPVVALVAGARRWLVVPAMECGRAQREAPRWRVLTPAELDVPLAQRRSVEAWALALVRLSGARRVCVSRGLPVGVARALARGRIALDVVEALAPERARKAPRELACIAEAQRAAVHGMRAARRLLGAANIGRGGVLRVAGRVLTSERVQQAIQQALLERRTFCRDAIVAGGPHGADPHERGHGPLRAGEPIVIDIFPQHLDHGYWGDITRTVVVGPVPAAVRRMHAAVAAAQREALRLARPGAGLAAVHQAVADVFTRRGYVTGPAPGGGLRGFFHGTGHGVGLEIHEAPSIAPVAGRLASRQVVTIEPGLYDPEIGGMRIEDTVEITATGCRALAACPKGLGVGR